MTVTEALMIRSMIEDEFIEDDCGRACRGN